MTRMMITEGWECPQPESSLPAAEMMVNKSHTDAVTDDSDLGWK